MNRSAIIVAGGSGSRMNATVPKQFMLLGGKPVLMHSIQRFVEADASTKIIVVLPGAEISTWEKLCRTHTFLIPHELAEGGETRFHSVKNGLMRVNEKSVVAVHDGVRPFASVSLIHACFTEAEKYGSAVPVVPLNESIRQLEAQRYVTADRSAFVIVQTPQCFDSDRLKEAYRSEYQTKFTDDSTVVESAGQSLHFINGDRENIKITFPLDLMTGEVILKNQITPG